MADEPPAAAAEKVRLPAATSPSKPDVNQLIAQLGDATPGVRDSAERQLIDLGRSVDAQVKQAADGSDDPEIRSRASAVLQAWITNETTAPSLITLHCKNVQITEALKVINVQARAHIETMGLAFPAPGKADPNLVTIDADDKPFWDVMADICRQIKAAPYMDYRGAGSFRIMPTWPNWMNNAPHQITGPFWVSVLQVSHNRAEDLETSSSPLAREHISVRMLFIAEPKVAVVQMSDFVVKQAIDNAGHSLMPKPAMQGAPVGAFRRVEQMDRFFDVELGIPDGPAGTKISVLQGERSVLIAQEVEQYQVDDVLGTPTPTKDYKYGKAKVSVTRQGGELRVDLNCTDINPEHWSTIVNCFGTVMLEDAKGHPLRTVKPVGMYSATDDPKTPGFKASGTFAAEPGETGPVSFKWHFPTNLKIVKVPIEFKDLPLP
jgi:hypothetical protein